VDSVGKPFNTNLYTYVAGNPVTWIDPWGLDEIDPRTGRDNPVLRCHAVTHNDPAENLKGALILVGVAGGLTLGPEVPAIARSLYYWLTVTYLKDPTTYNNFLEGFLSPGPPSTIQGSYGSITRIGLVAAHEYWRTYYNAPVRNNPAECDPCH
jgi:hypothetical protein